MFVFQQFRVLRSCEFGRSYERLYACRCGPTAALPTSLSSISVFDGFNVFLPFLTSAYVDHFLTHCSQPSTHLIRSLSNAALANAALVLSSKIGKKKLFEMGTSIENKSKKPWASIFTLSPCGNRCRFSESGIFFS